MNNMSNQIITSELLKEDPSLIDLIDRFLTRLPDMQAAITSAYDEQDWEIFLSLVHQMKGVGGNYGYSMLTTLCAEIETMAKEENFSEVKDKLVEFELMCEQILAGNEENHKIAKQ